MESKFSREIIRPIWWARVFAYCSCWTLFVVRKCYSWMNRVDLINQIHLIININILDGILGWVEWSWEYLTVLKICFLNIVPWQHSERMKAFEIVLWQYNGTGIKPLQCIVGLRKTFPARWQNKKSPWVPLSWCHSGMRHCEIFIVEKKKSSFVPSFSIQCCCQQMFSWR